MAAAATSAERGASDQSGVHRAVQGVAVLRAGARVGVAPGAQVQPAAARCVACGERDERVLRRVKLERERVVLCANDRERVLKINRDSRFFAGLGELEMDNRIRPLLDRYTDFDFRIDTTEWEVTFSREVHNGDTLETVDDIKVSRSEENIFIWCFFLAILQLVLDRAGPYKWVKYVYIDDPISSLDEQNAVAVQADARGMYGDQVQCVEEAVCHCFQEMIAEILKISGNAFCQPGGGNAFHQVARREVPRVGNCHKQVVLCANDRFGRHRVARAAFGYQATDLDWSFIEALCEACPTFPGSVEHGRFVRCD
jgi:hypothetical protein